MYTEQEKEQVIKTVSTPEGLGIWLAVGCAACRSYSLADGCKDPHGLELCFGQLRCKWCKKSREAFDGFLKSCNFSALQKAHAEVLFATTERR
jgi:hypothetical protein